MCNYGEYVKNEGKAEGRIEGKVQLIINKMKKRNISATEAMIQMDIDEKDFSLYLPTIQAQLNTALDE